MMEINLKDKILYYNKSINNNFIFININFLSWPKNKLQSPLNNQRKFNLFKLNKPNQKSPHKPKSHWKSSFLMKNILSEKLSSLLKRKMKQLLLLNLINSK